MPAASDWSKVIAISQYVGWTTLLLCMTPRLFVVRDCVCYCSLVQSHSWLADEADMLQLQREHVLSRERHLEERERRHLEVVAQLDRDVSGAGLCVCVCVHVVLTKLWSLLSSCACRDKSLNSRGWTSFVTSFWMHPSSPLHSFQSALMGRTVS